MSRSTPSENRSSLVAGFVLNALDASEAEAFAQLAEKDPTILEEVEQLQQSLETSFEVEEVAPPPILRDRLLDSFAPSIQEQSATVPAIPVQAELASPSNKLATWLKAAAATLAIALAFSNYFWWRSLQRATETPAQDEQVAIDNQPNTQTYELEPTEAGEGGTVQVTLDPATLAATLDATDLPLIGSDQVYVLWTVLAPDAPYTTDSKSAVLATTFEVDAQGRSQKTLTLPAAFQQPETVAAIAVTVESANAPQAHEGVPILIAPLRS